MEITISDQNYNTVNGTVPDDDWVNASVEACWEYLRRNHRGDATVTAREAGGENAGARICTLTFVLHDE